MGYVARPRIIDSYTPSDTVLVDNPPDVGCGGSNTYKKLKEITLVKTIYADSKFRFKFDLRQNLAGNTAYGKIYKNGVAIGTEQSVVGVAYVTKTEDINAVNWQIGDTIELWAKRNPDFGQAFVREFQMCGSGSPFINTLGA